MVNLAANHTDRALALSHNYAYTENLELKEANAKLKSDLECAVRARDEALVTKEALRLRNLCLTRGIQQQCAQFNELLNDGNL